MWFTIIVLSRNLSETQCDWTYRIIIDTRKWPPNVTVWQWDQWTCAVHKDFSLGGKSGKLYLWLFIGKFYSCRFARPYLGKTVRSERLAPSSWQCMRHIVHQLPRLRPPPRKLLLPYQAYILLLNPHCRGLVPLNQKPILMEISFCANKEFLNKLELLVRATSSLNGVHSGARRSYLQRIFRW